MQIRSAKDLIAYQKAYRILGHSAGWVYLVIVLDWFTEKVVGWEISLRGRSREWRQAMYVALERRGFRGSGLKLISGNGSQLTSVSFMREMGTLGIEQIFTS